MSTMSDELPMLALDSLPSGEPPDFAADYEVERSRVTVEFPLKLRPLFAVSYTHLTLPTTPYV